MNEALKQALTVRALEEGFSTLGICAPDAAPKTAERLRAFLAAGHHGQMAWMAEREAWRGNAAALWPEARSVIMLAESYTPQGDPLAVLAERDRAAISVYAQGKDYHDLVKRRLKRLGGWFAGVSGAEIKVFVDTAPVMEKPLAQAAGLGWQGKQDYDPIVFALKDRVTWAVAALFAVVFLAIFLQNLKLKKTII